jgi:light-regulated signal transduction histidine kinase (bacteriophytochrome)
MFSGITVIAAKINYLKDVEYIKDKAKLFKINKSLIKINTEIDQLNVAALHSMKTPLYVAEDFIKQLHKNTIPQKANFDSDEYITLINNSIHLSEMYVQNLFTYDAIITNTITYEYFNVLEKIKFVLEIATKKATNVSITIDCKDFMVHTNEFCFLVILENLITNGLKYNNSDRKTLTISARKNRYETVVRITDNGIGIEPIYFDRIFFPFVRINQNVQVDGTGLGLSSVKIAASKINGNVKIVESSKKGTTFEFNFKNN